MRHMSWLSKIGLARPHKCRSVKAPIADQSGRVIDPEGQRAS
jgi:hypothetical protein